MTGDFFDWKKESRSFSSMALFTTDLMNMAVNNYAVRVNGSRVTGDFFQLLGISPAIGRGVEPGDDDPEKPEVMVISRALWRSRFGGDPDVLGKKLLLNARTYQVIGIMPPLRAQSWTLRSHRMENLSLSRAPQSRALFSGFATLPAESSA
jgi:putative ABC transport system permease protein